MGLGWHPIYEMENKSHVPNHQPGIRNMGLNHWKLVNHKSWEMKTRSNGIHGPIWFKKRLKHHSYGSGSHNGSRLFTFTRIHRWFLQMFIGCSSFHRWYPLVIYTVFKVDGSALFQSARIDGADFLNFDTRKGRDIHPRYFCGPRHLCQKMFQGCAIYARILKSKISKPPFPFSSPFALNFPFLLPPFPFSFPSPLSFLLSLSPPFPPPFPLPLQMERFGNL